MSGEISQLLDGIFRTGGNGDPMADGQHTCVRKLGYKALVVALLHRVLCACRRIEEFSVTLHTLKGAHH